MKLLDRLVLGRFISMICNLIYKIARLYSPKNDGSKPVSPVSPKKPRFPKIRKKIDEIIH